MNSSAPNTPSNGSELSPRHDRFVDLVIEGESQTDSYVKCGYSPVNAAANASRLFHTPKIKAEVQRRRQDVAARADFTLEQALQVLSEIANDPEASDGDRTRATSYLQAAPLSLLGGRGVAPRLST